MAITQEAFLAKLEQASSNPASIMQLCLDRMAEAIEGDVGFVDPTNPAVSLLETAAVVGANSINQGVALVRKIYPVQAQTPDDLYNHMSYRDYLNRFASPSEDPFFFFVSLTQFMANARRPEGANYVMITIPRNTRVIVNDYVTFMLQYPIDIKYFDTQSIEVAYDAGVDSPFQTLSTSIILSDVIKEPSSNETWLRFIAPMPQLLVKKVTENVQPGKFLNMSVTFTDQYVATRAYYRNTATGAWTEMKTTYSPTVNDPNDPTVQLKVINDTLHISLPIVYQTTNQIIGEIRFDIYSSKGAEVINLAEYPASAYAVDMAPLDPSVDSNEFVGAATAVTVRAYSTSVMSGGKNALTFNQLKERVIYNSLGQQVVPITNVNARSFAENRGFELIPDVDVTTNRIFLATRSLPRPSDPRLVTAANIGISTFTTDDPATLDHPWVKVNQDRATFLSKNLYQMVNGQLKLLTPAQVTAIETMEPALKTYTVNTGNYMYSPFYYVLNTSSEELQTRAYHLDAPVARDLSFLDQNPTIQLVVNTAQYSIFKTDDGFKLRIQTRSGNYYKNLNDNEVYAQLAVLLPGSSIRAYWEGTLVGKTEDDERIYEFNLQTNYDIDTDNFIKFINANISSGTEAQALVHLSSVFDIFHITTSLTQLYRPSVLDGYIGKFLIPETCAAITHERLSIEFGSSLDGLWTRSRTWPDTQIYQRYTQDVPLTFDKDVYGTPPFTINPQGQIEYNVIYRAGDAQLDEEGEVIYLHKRGDVVLQDGGPVITGVLSAQREFDMLMVDGRNYFVTDDAYLAYNKEFVATIVDWVTEDIPLLTMKALDNTKIFFYPKNRLGKANILIADYVNMSIAAEQPITIDLYVTESVYRSEQLRSNIRLKIVQYLDQWISQQQLSVSAAQSAISDLFPDSVESIKISGLGPNKDMPYILIAAQQDRLSLRRTLEVQQDGFFFINEDVTVNFYKAAPIAAQ